MMTVTSYQHSPCAPILPLPIRRRRRMETGKVSAIWGYDYEHNGKNISFAAGEKFNLVEKSNDDWWLVSRIPGEKFFVPANYLKEETATEKVQKPLIITPKPQSPKLAAKLRSNSGGEVEKRKLKPVQNINRRSTAVSKKFMDLDTPELSPVKSAATFSYPKGGTFKDELNTKINSASRKLPAPPTILTSRLSADMTAIKELSILDDRPDSTYDKLEPVLDELYETVADPGNWQPKPAPRTDFSESEPAPHGKTNQFPSPPPRNHKALDSVFSANCSPPRIQTTTENTLRTNDFAPKHTRRSTISSMNSVDRDRPSRRPKSIEDTNNIRNFKVLPPIPLPGGGTGSRSASVTEELKSNLQAPCHDLTASMPGIRDQSNSFSPTDSPTNNTVSSNTTHKGLFTFGTMQFEKRGNVFRHRKDAGIFKGGRWDAQYMVLENFTLYFYKDSKVARSDSSQSQLIMELQYYYIYLVVDTKEKKNLFRLVEQETGDETLIQAESTAAMNEWFSIIQTTISQCSQSPRIISIPESAVEVVPESKIDDKRKDRLRKFLRQRPNMETLQKKGIIRYSIFGSPLESVVEKDRQNIPDFVCRCILEVESRGLDVLGIYRLAGNSSLIQKLRCIVDQEQLYNLGDLDAWDDVNIITGALKLFLREMPEPLVPFAHYKTFMDSAYTSDTRERIETMRNMFNLFPKSNYDLFNHLCRHLQVVVQQSDINKMKSSNLAIVFGPTLVRPEIDTANTIGHFTAINSSLEFVITHYDEIFNRR